MVIAWLLLLAAASQVLAQYTLQLQTLILYSDDRAGIIPRAFLDGLSSPYVLTSDVPDDIVKGNPSFYSIVVADNGVSQAAWAQLRTYAKRYNVRIVSLYTTRVDEGTGVDRTGPRGSLCVFDSSDFAKSIASVVTYTGAWVCDTNAQDARAVTITDPSVAKPVLRLADAGPGPVADGPVIAYVTNNPNGYEEMHFTINAGVHELNDIGVRVEPYSTMYHNFTFLNLALANMWFDWASRGVYLGQRRMLLQLHVDDWFISSDVYGLNKPVRINGDDVEWLAGWIDSLNQRFDLAEGSNVTLEPAFNGVGHTAVGFGDKTLAAATNQYLGKFNWISHTWTHQNMDWLEPSECNGDKDTCHPTSERISAELELNIKLAEGVKIKKSDYISAFRRMGLRATPGGQMFGYPGNEELAAKHWSPTCLVTPEISGLWPASLATPRGSNQNGHVPNPKNTEALQAIYDAGIRAVTGDNSRPELRSKKSPYWGIETTMEEYGVEGILIIPRQSPNLNYNSDNPESLEGWYNANGACNWAYYGTKCKDMPYPYDLIIQREGHTALFCLQLFRSDAYMFHQANLVTYNYNGKVDTIISAFTDKALENLVQYTDKMPVYSPKMEFTAANIRERMARDVCGLEGFVDHDANGIPTTIRVQATKSACTAVVSIGRNSGVEQRLFEVTGADGVESMSHEQTYRLDLQPSVARTLNVPATDTAPPAQGTAEAVPTLVNPTSTGATRITPFNVLESSASRPGATMAQLALMVATAALCLGLSFVY